jgi:hypothetical protein
MGNMSGQEIVRKYTERRLNPHPEFYSARGARMSDLDSDILEMVWKGVRNEHGEGAAARFVRFVERFPSLSATAFLNGFYSFVAGGCVDPKTPRKDSDDLDVGPDTGGPHRAAIGMFSAAMALSGMGQVDETTFIRLDFLNNHRSERFAEETAGGNQDA